jgi:hypothetical protein
MTHSNHGIVRDERGEEQPRDKQRAQTVHKWQSLKYDTNLGGYVTGITANELRNARIMARRPNGTGATTPRSAR